MYFEICLTKMNYSRAFLIYFPSTIYSTLSEEKKTVSAFTAGASSEDTEGTTTLFPVHSQLFLHASSHT